MHGVSILISKNISVDEISCRRCKFSRKMLINIKLNDVLYTLANMYGPDNIDYRVQFLSSSCKRIKKNTDSEDRLIVSGNMNCALTELDRPSGKKIDKSSHCLKQLLSFNDAVDVWRLLNKDKKTI